MKLIIGGIYLILLGIVTAVVFSIKPFRESVKSNWKSILIFTVLSGIAMNILLYLHLSQEQFISFWEFGGYWKKTLEINALLDKNISDALTTLWTSMQYSEYSYLPELFLSTPMTIIGKTYPIFVLLMFNLFVMPFNSMMYSFSTLVLEEYGKKTRNTLIVVGIVIAFFSANIVPMILGYIGVAILPLMASLVIIIYCKVFEKKVSWISIYVGLALILMVLIRRWTSYIVVGLFLGLGISYLVKAIVEKEDFKKESLPRFINLFICGLIPLVILVFGFPSLFQTFISYDYAFAYGDIKASGVDATLWFIQHYGILYVMLMILGIVIALKNKKTRWESLAMLISVLFTLIAFNQIQAMGFHHYLIINTYLLIFLLIGTVSTMNYLQRWKLSWVVPGILIMIQCTNTSEIFLHYRGDSVRSKTKMLISSTFPELRIRDDIETIQQITTFLKQSIGDSSVYVLATSEYFSEDILMNSLLPYDLKPISNMARSHVWDKRDGVPRQFFHYQYIVIADPIQFQFEPESHRVVSILVEGILEGGILQPYYEKIMTYDITKGIKVYIYKKVKEIPSEIVDKISNQFKRYYPDYPFLYEFDK